MSESVSKCVYVFIFICVNVGGRTCGFVIFVRLYRMI